MLIEVEIYKHIRKLTNERLSKSAIAKNLSVSRQTGKKYCEGGTFSENRKDHDRPAGVVSPEIIALIKYCIEADTKEKIIKQKHTAKWIYDRFCSGDEF